MITKMKMSREITIGEKYGNGVKITNQGEADEYFELCVLHTMTFGKTREEAISIEKQNFGYYSGYLSSDEADRVKKLYHCVHPVFG